MCLEHCVELKYVSSSIVIVNLQINLTVSQLLRDQTKWHFPLAGPYIGHPLVTSFILIYKLYFVFTMNYPVQRFLETYLLLVEVALVNSLQGALSKIKFLFFFFLLSRNSVSLLVFCLWGPGHEQLKLPIEARITLISPALS